MSALRHPEAEPATSPEPAPPLFRKEAVMEQQSQWLGSVLVEDTGFYRLVALVAAATIAAVLALLLFGTMSRKVTVTGGLVPQQGLARLVAPQQGVVSALHVHEGMAVKKGTPLLTLSAEVQTEGLRDARASVVRSLQNRQDSLSGTLGAQAEILERQAREFQARLASLYQEQRHLSRELELQRARVELGQRQVKREIEMQARGLIPLPRLERTKQEDLDQASRLQSLERAQTTLKRDIISAENQLRDMPQRRKTQLGELERSMSGLQQEMAEAESRRTIVLTAPADGIVTGLSVDLGSSVSSTATLLTVVPDNAVLQAYLFSPSSGIGFIKPGQRVKLRIQAFPYQKFGFQEGGVLSVARAASSPAELPPHLASMGSNPANEPVYKIVVSMPSQSVTAYGQQVPLQPGMRVDADVMIEKRSLLEWMFDPLLAITGKWG